MLIFTDEISQPYCFCFILSLSTSTFAYIFSFLTSTLYPRLVSFVINVVRDRWNCVQIWHMQKVHDNCLCHLSQYVMQDWTRAIISPSFYPWHKAVTFSYHIEIVKFKNWKVYPCICLKSIILRTINKSHDPNLGHASPSPLVIKKANQFSPLKDYIIYE